MQQTKYNEYQIAFSQLDYIIENSEENVRTNIPESFKKLIKNNKDSNYQVESDILINGQLTPKAKELMYLIYRDYLCNEETRQELIRINKERFDKEQEELNKKFEINWAERTQSNSKTENTAMIVTTEKWYEKIFRFIRKIFNK